MRQAPLPQSAMKSPLKSVSTWVASVSNTARGSIMAFPRKHGRNASSANQFKAHDRHFEHGEDDPGAKNQEA
jgi:hypothetical protein